MARFSAAAKQIFYFALLGLKKFLLGFGFFIVALHDG